MRKKLSIIVCVIIFLLFLVGGYMKFFQDNQVKNVFDEIYQISVMDGEYWITYEQYEKDFLDIDCYSPFNHDDKENNLHIFGKYFHS